MMNSLIAHWHLRFLPQSPSLLGTHASISSSAQSEGDGRTGGRHRQRVLSRWILFPGANLRQREKDWEQMSWRISSRHLVPAIFSS